MNKEVRHLNSLGGSSLELLQPVPITVVQLGPAKFVAEAHSLRLLLSAQGKTRSGAMRRLAGGIARQYRLLSSLPTPSQAPLQANLLCFLKQFIREAEQIDDAKRISGKSARGTGIQAEAAQAI